MKVVQMVLRIAVAALKDLIVKLQKNPLILLSEESCEGAVIEWLEEEEAEESIAPCQSLEFERLGCHFEVKKRHIDIGGYEVLWHAAEGALLYLIDASSKSCDASYYLIVFASGEQFLMKQEDDLRVDIVKNLPMRVKRRFLKKISQTVAERLIACFEK